MTLDENKEFNRAVAFVCQTGKNLFLTGKAGTGKTTFLKYIREHCYKNMAVLAPTGVAAINAGGVTIHSFFQLPFGMYIPDAITEWGNPDNSSVYNKSRLLSKLRLNRSKLEVIRELDTLIIDEISMVRADLLDAVDDVLRAIRRRPDDAFGGVQMILIGDLFQLPPVVRNDELPLLQSHYKSPFFFDARVIQNDPPVFIELQKIYRQSDEKFISLLNNVRNNCCGEEEIEMLNSYHQPDFEPGYEEEYITLASHNFIADRINQMELDKLPGKRYSFDSIVTGDFPERSFPADKTLELKLGTQVMFIKNDSGETRRFYNGKIGRIEKIDNDRKVWVRFKEEEALMELPLEKWSNIKYNYNNEKDNIEEEELGTFEQFPIRLAWAVTIHKSQGLTFDRAIIDAGKSFAAGQVYVALSRLRSLHGLVLRSRILPGSIATDSSVLAYIQTQAEALDGQEILLEEERKMYVGQSLLRAFRLEKLAEKTFQFLKSFDDKKMESKELFVQRGRKILTEITDMGKTADKFCHQLEILLPDAPADAYKHLCERTNAATAWFCQQLDEKIIVQWKDFLQLAKTKNRTVKLQKDVQILITDFERRRQHLQQIAALIAGLAAKKDLRELLSEYTEAQHAKGAAAVFSEPIVKADTRTLSLELYKAGKSIEQIAKERSLQQSTIETHLMQFIPTGEVDISLFITEKDAKRLKAFLDNHPSDIGSTEIKAAFEDEFSYSQIRAVRKWVESKGK